MTKAEFLKLPMDQRGKILEEQAESVADIYNTPPGLCPDPIPDHIQDELTTLRDRVRELESVSELRESEEREVNCRMQINTAHALIEQQANRIRELEEAMPDVAILLGMLTQATPICLHGGLKMDLREMASRIDKVMTKHPSEK